MQQLLLLVNRSSVTTMADMQLLAEKLKSLSFMGL